MTQMKPSPDVLCRELGEELVLLDLGSSKYFSLNRTGAVIWNLLEQGEERGSIARQLSEKFDVDEQKAMSDVEDLIDRLYNARLISKSD